MVVSVFLEPPKIKHSLLPVQWFYLTRELTLTSLDCRGCPRLKISCRKNVIRLLTTKNASLCWPPKTCKTLSCLCAVRNSIQVCHIGLVEPSVVDWPKLLEIYCTNDKYFACLSFRIRKCLFGPFILTFQYILQL